MYLPLSEISSIHVGNKPPEISSSPLKYEYINAGTSLSGYTAYYNCSGDTVTTPSRGQGGIGFIGYQSQPFWLGPLCYQIKSTDSSLILTRYIYYYLSAHKDLILQYKNEGGTPSLNISDLAKVKIAIPPLEEQKSIVSILDRFDTLCNDLSAGLPAEIAARQQQYEYYRDKLLTFKELT